MEIKITLKKHEEVVCDLPFEVKIEETDFDEKFKPIPNYSSINEFFESEELAQGYIIETLQNKFQIGYKKICKVTPCHNSKFHGMDCLEDDDKYGFFKSESDIRPSSCSWINKAHAEILYRLFKKSGADEKI